MMSSIRTIAFLTIGAVFALSACGDDDDDDTLEGASGGVGNGGRTDKGLGGSSGRQAGGASGHAGMDSGGDSGNGGSAGVAGVGGERTDGGSAGEGDARGGVGGSGNDGGNGGLSGGNDGAGGNAGNPGGSAGEAGAGGGAGGGGDPSQGGAGGDGGDAESNRWIAFQLVRLDDSKPLFIATARSREAVQLAPDVLSFQWSSDGQRLLYVTASSEGSANAAYLVKVTPTGPGEPEPIHSPLAPGDRVLNASLSPDARALAVQLFEGEIAQWYVRRAEEAADDWNPIGLGVPDDQLGAEPGRRFSWSPNGARLAIVERETDAHDYLQIVDADGHGTGASFEDLWLLEWSADGTRLVADGLYFAPLQQRALFLIDAAAVDAAVTISAPATHSNVGFGRIAPDGSAVAFQAIAAQGRLFVKSLAGSNPAVPVSANIAQDAQWFTNSRGLLVWGYGPDEVSGPNLYAIPKLGGAFTKLNPPDTLAHCNSGVCIARAGDSFVFTTLEGVNEQTGNQLYDVDTSLLTPSVRRLTQFPEYSFVDSFRVAPSSSLVLAIATVENGDHTLYAIDRSGSEAVTRPALSLPNGASPFTYDAPFSADSRFFCYGANHDRDVNGNSDLFIGEVVGGIPTILGPLTSNTGAFTLWTAAWQP